MCNELFTAAFHIFKQKVFYSALSENRETVRLIVFEFYIAGPCLFVLPDLGLRYLWNKVSKASIHELKI
jgi:hypothetical protein